MYFRLIELKITMCKLIWSNIITVKIFSEPKISGAFHYRKLNLNFPLFAKRFNRDLRCIFVVNTELNGERKILSMNSY